VVNVDLGEPSSAFKGGNNVGGQEPTGAGFGDGAKAALNSLLAVRRGHILFLSTVVGQVFVIGDRRVPHLPYKLNLILIIVCFWRLFGSANDMGSLCGRADNTAAGHGAPETLSLRDGRYNREEDGDRSSSGFRGCATLSKAFGGGRRAMLASLSCSASCMAAAVTVADNTLVVGRGRPRRLATAIDGGSI